MSFFENSTDHICNTFVVHFKRMDHTPTPASLSQESPPAKIAAFQMPPGSFLLKPSHFCSQSGLFTPSSLQICSHPILNHFVQCLSRERYHSATA